MDETLYRTTILCRCAGDYSEGYGPTQETATANAWKFFFGHNHKEADAESVIHEIAVPHGNGGSHYEELTKNGTSA